MPAKSKAQFRLMKAVQYGNLKIPGLSKKEAEEYTDSNKGKKAYPKLRERLGKK